MTIIVQAWIKRGQKTMFPQQVCPSLQSVLDLMVILANFKRLDPTPDSGDRINVDPLVSETSYCPKK